MESESLKKRNVFRASLRQEFIEAHQHKIRMKYLQMQQEERQRQIHRHLQSNIDSMVKCLEDMLQLKSEQLCTQDNFGYLIDCIQIVNNRNERKSNLPPQYNKLYASKHSAYENQQIYQSQGKRQKNSDYSRFSSNGFDRQQYQNSKICGVWKHKQKIYSLLYRILNKALTDNKNKLWYVVDKVLYMLQFPQLMPLWQKLSRSQDQKVKGYCSKQFCKKLFKPLILNTLPNNQISILDPDFALDIVINFVVERPSITFEQSLELFPFISYSLNSYSQIQKSTQQQIYPKLNKVCLILRACLRQNSHQRILMLIQCGYDGLFQFMVSQIYKLFGCQKYGSQSNINYIMEQQNKNARIQNFMSFQKNINDNECSWQHMESNTKICMQKTHNLQIVTKLNLLKFLNRLFVSSPEVASIILRKTNPKLVFFNIFNQFQSPVYSCFRQQQPILHKIVSHNESQQQKYSFIKLCTSHRQLLRTSLNTVNVILMTASTNNHDFIVFFLQAGGMNFLRACAQVQKSQQNIDMFYSSQIANIIASLDNQSKKFYDCLTKQAFKQFLKLQANLLSQWINKYEAKIHSAEYPKYLPPSLLQLRMCLLKVTRSLRSSLLMSYVRATQPQIYKYGVDYISYSCNCIHQLGQLYEITYTKKQNWTKMEKQEQVQINIYARAIVQICEDVKHYLRNEGNRKQNHEYEIIN